MTITSLAVVTPASGTAVAAPYGARGPVCAGTSLSTAGISVGTNVTLTMVEYGLSFTPGQRIRATAMDTTPGTWMEGIVTSYDGIDLKFNCDYAHGASGPFASWSVGVTGEIGSQGAPGPQGPSGLIPEAPNSGEYFCRQSLAWSAIDTIFAHRNSPNLTGTPTTPDVTAGDSSSKIANTKYVMTALTGGYLPLTGGSMSGDLAISKAQPFFHLYHDAGSLAAIYSHNRASGNARWAILFSEASAESGFNNGSNFRLDRFADDGTYLNSPIAIARSSGVMTLDKAALNANCTAWTATAADNSTRIATTEFVKLTSQPLDAELTALASIVSAADRVPYFTGSGAAAAATLTAFGRSLIDDADAASARNTLGAQALDPDLTSIAGASTIGGATPGSGTATGLFYRKADGNWVGLKMGNGITLDAASDTISVVAGGGNVSTSGSPAVNQLGLWASSNTIKGDARLIFDGTTLALQVPVNVSMANPALYLSKAAAAQGNFIIGMSVGVSRWQMQLGDATAEGTGTAGSDFSLMRCDNAGATLDYPVVVSRADGHVSLGAKFHFYGSQSRAYINGLMTIGSAGAWLGFGLEQVGTAQANSTYAQQLYSNDGLGPLHYLDKSRGTALNTYAAVVANDLLGSIQFRGSDATAMRIGGSISCIVQGAPTVNGVPSLIQINAGNASGIATACIQARGTGAEILGVTDGHAAGVGWVGEVIDTGQLGPVGWPGNSWNIGAQLNMPPGDWDLYGYLASGPGGMTASTFGNLCISNTPASPSGPLQSFYAGGNGDVYVHIGPTAVRLAVTTTYYLNGALNVTSVGGFYCRLWARRRH